MHSVVHPLTWAVTKNKRLPIHARGFRVRWAKPQNRIHATRRPKHHRATRRGEMVQFDTLHLRYLPGTILYQFTDYDPVAKLPQARVTSSGSAASARAALEQLLDTFPVQVRGEQVDNGSEFRSAREQFLHERGIPMQLIQPRSPNQNAHVERCQRSRPQERYETTSQATTVEEHNRDDQIFA